MRDVLSTEELVIPDGVTATIKSRLVTVTGPRGTLKKNLRHVNMDIQLVPTTKLGKTVVTLAVWQGGRKHVACLRTIRSLINNLIIGVTKVRTQKKTQSGEKTDAMTFVSQGFLYKMRAVYAHFPINCIIAQDGHSLEIRNFLGEKVRAQTNPFCLRLRY